MSSFWFVDKIRDRLGTGLPDADLGIKILGQSFKIKKLTGTTSAAEGGTVNVAHGLTSSSVLGVIVAVDYDGTGRFHLKDYGGTAVAEVEYHVLTSVTNLTIENSATNSGSMLSKSFRAIVFYE